MRQPEIPGDPVVDAVMAREWSGAAGERPSAAVMERVEERVRRSMKPVQPLPSDRVLALICVIAFMLLAIAGTMPVGFTGFHRMPWAQMTALYAAVIGSAVLLALALVNQMIPGARVRFPPALAIVTPLVLLAIVVLLVFPNAGMANFVRRGYPCLRLGTLSAIPGGVFSYVLLSRGWMTDPLPAALVAGAFSGLVGFGVLSLNCPIFNSLHILIWHVSVILVAVTIGAAAGVFMNGLIRGAADRAD